MLTPFAELLASLRAGTAVGAFTCYDTRDGRGGARRGRGAG